MDKLVLSDITQSRIEALLKRAPHAVIIVGAAGSGRGALAFTIAKAMGARIGDIQVLNNQAEGSLGIEASRAMQRIYKLKATSKDAQRALIIEDAERLTNEAQNALLKLVEEPPEGAMFFFTVQSMHALLPTIRSRAAHLLIDKPAKDRVTAAFTANKDAEIGKKYSMADGQIGTLSRLITDKDYYAERSEELAQAKSVIQASQYERFSKISSMNLKKIEATRLLRDMLLVLQLSTERATESKAALAKIVFNSMKVLDCMAAIEKNGQVKLQMDSLVANIK